MEEIMNVVVITTSLPASAPKYNMK